MTADNTPQLLATATQHLRAGRLDHAQQLYQAILARHPQHAHALGGLALLAHAAGQPDTAAALLQRAIASSPDTADFHLNLGLIELARGRIPEALAANQQGVRLLPQSPAAHFNLANALVAARRLPEAITEYQTALRLQPTYVEALYNLGTTLHAAGQTEHAAAVLRQVLRLRPNHADAHNNLAIVLSTLGAAGEALQACQRTVQLQPSHALTHYNLGLAHMALGQPDHAITAFRQALRLQPHYPEAHNNLGSALKDVGLLDEALHEFRTAADQGSPEAGSNLIYTLNFHPACDARAIYEEASRWNLRHALPLATLIQPHPNPRDPDRPLRIGYVSPDFRTHPIGQSFLPLAQCHDRQQFRVFCYSGVRRPDAFTQRLQSLADQWRNTAALSPPEIAALIRRDQIDILVDLTMHMARNHLLVFAQKPAPIQISALCLLCTTGLTTIDYRLTDHYCDPPGINDAFYSEETLRLPDCYLCREPPADSPPINPLPAATAGHITFGSLNNFAKVTPQVLQTWSRILLAVPNSRLLLRCPAPSAQARVSDTFAAAGIAPARLAFDSPAPSYDHYLRQHHAIDIYLDTFPYCGITTSMDALWMGVPLVTLAGPRDVHRGGVYLLSNLALPDLITHTPNDYVRRAIALAHDLPRLTALRSTLRDRMRASPLMDMPRYTRSVEAAYRTIWQRWCAGGTRN